MVYMMCGIQGSGKSTYARQMGKEMNIPVLSSDSTRQEFPGVPDKIIWPYLYSRAALYIRCGQDFIFDATNITKSLRHNFFTQLERFNAHPLVTVVWVRTTREKCIERVIKRNQDPNELYLPLEVIDNYISRFEEPTLDEGFKEIKIVEN